MSSDNDTIDAPREFDPADAPAPAPTPTRKIIRQVTLTQYEGGAFGVNCTPTEGVEKPLSDDLPGLKGLLDYAVRWINHTWELGEMADKWETQQRLMMESQQKVQPAPPGVLGSAGRFFGGKRH